WRQGDVSHSGLNGSDPELRNPLPEPSEDVPHLDIYVRLKPPPQVVARNETREPEIPLKPAPEAVAPDESREPEIPLEPPPEVVATKESPTESGEPGTPNAKCQDLEARWNAILGVEAGIETLRLRMDGVRAELEACWNKTLTPEERLHALKADVAQWTKAKTRVHYAVPKVKEFVHRATWALGAPERKRLEELFKDDAEPNIPLPQMERVPDQLESLLKDRQILSSQGVTVYQE